jgi:Beta-propeller repeat
MKRLQLQWSFAFILLVLAACSSEPVQGSLTKQDFGTLSNDYALDVATPKGGVGAVVVGVTSGALDGVNKGGSDAFIRRYDGGVVWASQFGTRSADYATDVAVTNTGLSYVLGYTQGALGFKVGGFDVFLRKYDANGLVQWTRQFGTPGDDFAKDVTLDGSGNVYILSGDNGTGFRIRKFNPSGTLLLTISNFSAKVSNPAALAVDSTGNICVLTGFFTTADVALLSKYNSAGTPLPFSNIFVGDGSVFPYDLVIDSSNNLYFSVTDDGFNRGGYVRKVNTAGATLWTVNIEPATGTRDIDAFPQALALGSQGNVNVTGLTTGAYTGFTNAGTEDIFVLQLSGVTGARFWTRQIGGNGEDRGNGIAVSDTVYVAGSGNSDPNLLGDPAYGGVDAFLAQLDRATGTVLGIDQ